MSRPLQPAPPDSSTTATLARVTDEPTDGVVTDRNAAPDDGSTEASASRTGEARTEEKVKLDLSLTGVVGSSLAAITAAYLGSKLGVAGTIIGAGLGSVVSAVAAALYTASLRQSRSGLRTAMAQLRPGADGNAATTDDAKPTESRLSAFAARLRPHWKKIAGGAAVVFVIAIAAITTYETVAGKTLSGTQGDTSVSRVFGAQDTRTSPPSEPTTRDDQTTPRQSDATRAPRGGGAPASEASPTQPSTPAAPSSGAAPTSAAPDKTSAPTTEQPAPTTAAPSAPTTAAPNGGTQGGAAPSNPATP